MHAVGASAASGSQLPVCRHSSQAPPGTGVTMDALDEAGVLEQLISRIDINELVETGLPAASQGCRSAVLASLRAASASGGSALEPVLSPLLALARAPAHMLPLDGASVSAENPLVSVPGETLVCVPLNRTGLSTLGAAVLQLASLPGGAIAARPFSQVDGTLTPGSTRILLGPRVAFAEHSNMLLVSGCICSEDERTTIVALPALADDESPSDGASFKSHVCSLFEEEGVEEEFVEVYLPNFLGSPVVCKLAPGTVTDISNATFASLGLSPFPGDESVFSMTLDVNSSAVTVMATPSNRTIWVSDEACEYKKARARSPANTRSLPEGELVFFSPFTPPPPPSRSRRGQGQSTDTAPRAPKAGDKGFEFAMAWRFATRYMVAPKAAEATREPAGAQLSSTSVAAPGPSVEGEFVA